MYFRFMKPGNHVLAGGQIGPILKAIMACLSIFIPGDVQGQLGQPGQAEKSCFRRLPNRADSQSDYGLFKHFYTRGRPGAAWDTPNT